MRKIILFTFMVVLTTQLMAVTFYVDPVNGQDSNNGTSWKTAVRSINTAALLASANAGVDNIFVKAGVISSTGVLKLTQDNYYGGFTGTESKPEQRIILPILQKQRFQ